MKVVLQPPKQLLTTSETLSGTMAERHGAVRAKQGKHTPKGWVDHWREKRSKLGALMSLIGCSGPPRAV